MERKFNYKYVINEEKRTIVCLTTFAGQVVRGVARCSPNDEWNIEVGKEYATARCAAKVALKRLRRAEDLVKWSHDALEFYNAQVSKYEKYELDAIEEVKITAANLKKIEDRLQ